MYICNSHDGRRGDSARRQIHGLQRLALWQSCVTYYRIHLLCKILCSPSIILKGISWRLVPCLSLPLSLSFSRVDESTAENSMQDKAELSKQQNSANKPVWNSWCLLTVIICSLCVGYILNLPAYSAPHTRAGVILLEWGFTSISITITFQCTFSTRY